MANFGPWFRSFTGNNLKSTWEKVSKSWLKSTDKKAFYGSLKETSKEFLMNSTDFERYAISEVTTSWLPVVGDPIQLAMLNYFKRAGLAATNLSPIQKQASNILGLSLGVGATITAVRAFNKLRRSDDDPYAKPPRYRKAYSRLHAMEHGQPFFGSGAVTDEILRHGVKTLQSASLKPIHIKPLLNPKAGGMVQELARTANTHHLIGSAATDFNISRLFRF